MNSTWEVTGSEKVGLIGSNGCGKSTQLLMILGSASTAIRAMTNEHPQVSTNNILTGGSATCTDVH
eukprot:2386547-Amphidinium_carterae.2